jgi:hypothetical protein
MKCRLASSRNRIAPSILLLLLLSARCAGVEKTPAPLLPPEEVTELESKLPLVVVDAGLKKIRDEPRVEARLEILDDPEGGGNHLNGTPVRFSGDIRIGIRGQSSRGCPKKQYGFEILGSGGAKGREASLLGMPAASEWILQGPCFDRSLIRNVLAYQLSNRIGRYAVRTRFIEAYIREDGAKDPAGGYQGVFVLMEKITRGPERVNVAPATEEDPSGGYILKIDRGPEPFFTTARGTRILCVDPPSPTPAQVRFLKSYFDELEAALMRDDFGDPDQGYARYIDVDSFIDHFLLNELLRNVDAFRLSAYLHKDRAGKVAMGPVWDFDRSSGNIDTLRRPEGWSLSLRFTGYQPPFWWKRLLEDEDFCRRLAERWKSLREDAWSPASIDAAIEKDVSEIADAARRNFQVWPFLGSRRSPFDRDPVASPTFAGEIQELKDFLAARGDWMDHHVDLLPAGIGEGETTGLGRGSRGAIAKPSSTDGGESGPARSSRDGVSGSGGPIFRSCARGPGHDAQSQQDHAGDGDVEPGNACDRQRPGHSGDEDQVADEVQQKGHDGLLEAWQ